MFGLYRAEVIGPLGADVTVNHLTNGGRVANMSIGTDESFIDRNNDVFPSAQVDRFQGKDHSALYASRMNPP